MKPEAKRATQETAPVSLDTPMFPAAAAGRVPERPCSQATGETLPRWLTVEQIRKMQRMRREAILDAMLSGELPFEQRGRIRYARLTDVIAWEERRLARRDGQPLSGLVHPDLAGLA